MAKTKQTKLIEDALCREYHRQYGCLEVSIGIGSRIKERVDFMVFDHYQGVFKCFEIKVSKSDFRSSAKKSFVGHHNYYVMPPSLYHEVKDEIPNEVGVFLAYIGENYSSLENVKKCRRKELSDAEITTLKDSLIRSLSRDANKYYTSERAGIVDDLKQQLSQSEKRAERARKDKDDYHWELRSLQRKLRYIYGEEWDVVIESKVSEEKAGG